MSDKLQALLDQLKAMGASESDLEHVRGATVSIHQNQGVVAGTVSGPIAIGTGASAVQGPQSSTTAPPESPQQDGGKTQGKPGREEFWDRAMGVAKSAGSVAEAVSKIIALAKPFGLG